MGREGPSPQISPEHLPPPRDVAPEQAPTPENPETIKEIYRQKLMEGRVGALIKTLLADPNARRIFLHNFKDRGILPFQGEGEKDPTQWATPLITSMMRDTALRQLLMEAMLEDLREESDERKKTLRGALSKMEKGVYDEDVEKAAVYHRVVVGGGVHATIFNTALMQRTPRAKTLTVDESDVVSRNFYTKGFVSINTRNQAQTEQLPNMELKRGNLNFFGKKAPIQLPYVEPELYPSARSIAEVATANQFLSGSDVLLETKVERVIAAHEDPGSGKWPAQQKILFQDGTYVFADEVIVSTGLGAPEYPRQFDEETKKLVERDSRPDEEGRPPGVMTYEQFADYLTSSYTPLRYFAGRKVDIGGGGDGAATVIEQLLRFAKRTSYKLDVAQTGVPERIHWVGQNIEDSKQYKNLLANERYLMLATEMPLTGEEREKYKGKEELERKIEPVNGYLVQIRDSDDPSRGRYRVTYTLRNNAGVREEYTDFVIIAAGYTNRIGQLFGEEDNPFDDPERSEAVKADLVEEHVRVPVGVKMKDREVYAVGPASIGQVLSEAEVELAGLSGVGVNRPGGGIAIGIFGPRTERLAEALAEEPLRPLAQSEKKHGRLELTALSPDASQEGATFLLRRERHTETMPPSDLLEGLRIKSGIAKVLEDCDTKALGLDRISISVKRTPRDKDAVSVSFLPALEQSGVLIEKLKKAGLTDPLIDELQGGRWDMTIEIPIMPSGRVSVPAINIKHEIPERAQ